MYLLSFQQEVSIKYRNFSIASNIEQFRKYQKILPSIPDSIKYNPIKVKRTTTADERTVTNMYIGCCRYERKYRSRIKVKLKLQYIDISIKTVNKPCASNTNRQFQYMFI